MLETMGVDHVVSVDLHSAQIEGFFKPQIPQTLGEPIVVEPHSAAVNRAAKFRYTLSRTIDEFVPLAFVIRKHHLDKHQPGELVGDVNGKDSIVVDTLVGTTEKVLKTNGAKTVSAFAVHARYSADVSLVPSSLIVALQTLENCKELDNLVTTNTIPMHFKANEQSSKIVTLSVAPFVAEVISCIHTKSSIIQVEPLYEEGKKEFQPQRKNFERRCIHISKESKSYCKSGGALQRYRRLSCLKKES
ncbi:hypothetical protein PsorP6_006002 [Peronosclerospora sorghi]|uniref:Uncharacterized protein n=1 Tax=Peronosclerospora sorghi TaxID=230839 RepID=A0ACC0W5Q9_9STRA|nr:hypothetical protein PsorP6_006002 [Peronosclerospora sorghi]